MIRLFRKIRHQLLSGKSYSIYLLYAAGEIVLVMIGILLALQIDNWNEQKKARKELIEIFDEVREDLVLDTTSIANTLRLRIQDLEAQTRLMQAIRDDLPFNDQIKSDLGQIILKRPVHLVSSGFNLLRESSLTSIENKDFRSELIEYYEQDVSEMKEEYQDDKFEFETVLLPYVRNNFREWNYGESAIPVDWNDTKEHLYFMTALLTNLTNLNSTIHSLERGLESSTQLITLLDSKQLKHSN